MRFVYLEADVAPAGQGFYVVGPDGVDLSKCYSLEDVLALRAGLVGVWNSEPERLEVTEDRDCLGALLEEAQSRGSAVCAGSRALDGLVALIIGAPLEVEHGLPGSRPS